MVNLEDVQLSLGLVKQLNRVLSHLLHVLGRVFLFELAHQVLQVHLLLQEDRQQSFHVVPCFIQFLASEDKHFDVLDIHLLQLLQDLLQGQVARDHVLGE